MQCIKNIALTEPLIDVVHSDQIITSVTPILTLDIMTCTIDQLNFSADFKLRYARNDYCHAIVGYFECAFSMLDNPVVFSTSPYHKSTHWKQTVFYLEEDISGEIGEEIEGRIVVAANSRNPRDLDITIGTAFRGKFMSVNKEKLYRLR
jgi:type I protein arginine methyltransferase